MWLRTRLIAPTLQPIADGGDLSGFVTLTFRHGEIAQLLTLGHRDIERKLPMERDTLFRIASMTKAVTSTAAMQLVEQGRFGLDDPEARARFIRTGQLPRGIAS